jgi:hypothetical protein
LEANERTKKKWWVKRTTPWFWFGSVDPGNYSWQSLRVEHLNKHNPPPPKLSSTSRLQLSLW